jgi:hypothetical protein
MRTAALFIFSILLITGVHAADSSDGCGIGNLLYGKKSLLGTSVRMTTNSFLGIINIGATTTGTSGCARHSIVKADMRAIHYMEENTQNLLTAFANGQGEHLHALSKVMGCDQVHNGYFNEQMKKNFGSLIEQSQAPANMLIQVKSIIHQDQVLASACSQALKV